MDELNTVNPVSESPAETEILTPDTPAVEAEVLTQEAPAAEVPAAEAEASVQAAPAAPVFCPTCGYLYGEGERFCAKCGTPKPAPAIVTLATVCPACLTPFEGEQMFCAKCGVARPVINTNAPAVTAAPQQKKSAAPLIIGIVAGVAALFIAAVVIIFVMVGLTGNRDFNDMYSDISSNSWCTIADDGTWMKLDTNPYDIEDSFNTQAWTQIKTVLDDLGFASAVSEEMMETRSIDGRQSASADGYEVSWSYHPDDGLEVLFDLEE